MTRFDAATRAECQQLLDLVVAIRKCAAFVEEAPNLSPKLLLRQVMSRFGRILPVTGIPKQHWKAVGTMVIVLCFLDDDSLNRAAAESGAAPFIFWLCRRAYALYSQDPISSARKSETSVEDVLSIQRDVDALPPVEREIVRRRLWDGTSLRQLGKDFDLPFSVVAQIALRFFGNLKRYLDG